MPPSCARARRYGVLLALFAISGATARPLRSIRPYQSDQTADGRILKLLHVVDEHTREAPAIRRERRIDSDATAAVLESP